MSSATLPAGDAAHAMPDDPRHRTVLVQGGHDFAGITDLVCAPIERRTPKAWYIAFGISSSLLLLLLAMVG